MAFSISPSNKRQRRTSWDLRLQAAHIIDIHCASCTGPVLRLLQEMETRHAGPLLSCWPRLRVMGSPRLPQVYAEAGVVSGAFVDGFPVPEHGATSPLVTCDECVASGGAVAQDRAEEAAKSVDELLRMAKDDREEALQLEREISAL